MALVTLAECKEFMRISHSARDNVINILIDGVDAFIEKATGLLFAGAAYDTVTEELSGGTLNLWPNSLPLQTVTTITDTDTGLEIDSDIYSYNSTRIWRADDSCWAVGQGRYDIEYTAGILDADLPGDLKMVALQLVSRNYDAHGGQQFNSTAGYIENWRVLTKTDEWKTLMMHRPSGAF